MTTHVDFETAKLLKEKGFNEYCKLCVEEGDERPLPFNAGNTLHKNSLHPYYSAPTIAEVVMWLYEKHGIWIETPFWDSKFRIKIINTIKEEVLRGIDFDGFNSPTEAYEDSIKYVLTKLI